MKNIILVIVLMLAIDIRAQKENIVPPSPQAALIENYYQKYFTSEVSSSGSQRIDVPLWNIKVPGLEIPIALSYTTGGIRYKQEDGDVGVGWNLTPNLRISRTVIGRPDEEMKRVSNITATLNSLYDPREHEKYLTQFATGVSGNEYASSDISDAGADIFSFSTLTQSGHFIFPDANDFSKAEIIEALNLVITPVFDDAVLLGFEIKDENGYIYRFGGYSAPNLTESAYQGPTKPASVTGWALRSIDAPNGESVEFKYIGYSDNDLVHPENKSVTVSDSYFADPSYSGSLVPSSVSYSLDQQILWPNYTTFYVSEIKTRNQIVSFFRNGRVLSNINVLDRITNTVIKNIDFIYSGASKQPHYFLDSVSLDDQQYSFTYYTPADLGFSPTFQSNHYTSDLWGYYLYSQYQDFNASNYPNLHSELGDINYIFNVSTPGGYNYEKTLGNLLGTWNFKNSSNNMYGHLFSLKKMVLPTKGYIFYEYEPNKYLQNGTAMIGAGCRIKKITSNDLAGSSYIKTLTYGYNENQMGIPSYYLSPYDYTSEQLIRIKRFTSYPYGEYYTNHLSHTFSPNIIGDFGLSQDFMVEYPEINVNDLSNNDDYLGRTTYEFEINQPKVFEQHYSDFSPHDYRMRYALNVTGYQFGLKTDLKSKTYYDATNAILKEENYTYGFTDDSRVIEGGIKLKQSMVADYENIHGYNTDFPDYYEVDRPRTFSCQTYSFYTGRKLLLNKTVIEYPDFEISHQYSYNSRNQVSTDITINSKGEIVKTEYKYPYELIGQKPLMQEMVDKNMIAEPVITNNYVNNNLISQSETQYGYHTSSYLILPSFVYSKKGSTAISALDKRVTYNNYDDKGNLTQYTPENGISVSIIWGYNKTMPIAKIENASYGDVSGYVSNLQNLSDAANETSLLNALDSLRTALPYAMITTYTYKPLIGISTVTDPKGDVITYKYDTSGRLEVVKDKNGNILSENQYHYQTF
ncbi:hypothetical protein [Flavobacterium sp. 3-210]